MKHALLDFSSFSILTACCGPGGPAQRAEAAWDQALYQVGEGISSVGKKIENSPNP